MKKLFWAFTVMLAVTVVKADDISPFVDMVTDNGGSVTGGRGYAYVILNQGNFTPEGREFATEYSMLVGEDLGRAANELVGEGATTATVQSALSGAVQSAGAVSRQLSIFRSGGVASALASTFISSGATAALGEMADADNLEEAYNTAEAGGSTQAGEVYNKFTVWASIYSGWGNQDGQDYTFGYEFSNVGVMCGMDYAFGRELRVGALLGYSYNNTLIDYKRGESTDDIIRLGTYGSYSWDNFFVDLSPTVGIHMIESRRRLFVNDVIAKGQRTGIDFNMTGTVGYTFELPLAFTVTPSYTLGYTFFNDPKYTETGAGAGNLTLQSFNSNSLIQDIGVKAGRLFKLSSDVAFLPEVWGGWETEFLNTGGVRDSTTAAAIGGQTYGTNLNGMETYRFYWGVGLTALLRDSVSLYGRYDYKGWRSGSNVGVSAGIKVEF